VPLLEAVEMEDMCALAPDEGAVIAGNLAGWTAAVVGNSADSTEVIQVISLFIVFSDVPVPLGYRMPMLDGYLHFIRWPVCRGRVG